MSDASLHTYLATGQGTISTRSLQSLGSILQDSGLLQEYKKIVHYFDLPFFKRSQAEYSKSFIRSYNPTKSPLLREEDTAQLVTWNKDTLLSTDFLKKHTSLYKSLIYDFTYNSLRLDGVHISYPETKELTKTYHHKSNKGKTLMQNHEVALEYIVDNKYDINLNSHTLRYLHKVLGKNISQGEMLGTYRKDKILISGSNYTPPTQYETLNKEAKLFFRKLNLITNPFEQSLFILTYLPYLQLFEDFNKRTSRLFCNIPLIKNNLIPFAFLTVEKEDYMTSLLAVYELRDTRPLRKVFMNSYEKAYNKYFRQTLS